MTEQPPPSPGPDPPPPPDFGPSRDGSGFERSGTLASAIVTVAVAWAVIQWLWVLTAPSAVQTYRNAFLSPTSAAWIFTTYDFLGVLFNLVSLAAFILTGIWLARARRNADRIAPLQQRRSCVWVWLGWLVPVVALWFPKQVVDDVWRSTVHDTGQPSTGWWWGSWIATQLLNSLTAQAFSITGTPREWILENLVFLETLAAIAATIAVLGWIRVVQTLSQAQDALADGTPPPQVEARWATS